MTTPANAARLDILVVGGGQAALALGYHLRHLPYRFQLVERHQRIGESWRNRYDSLVLFTPRAYSSLPGLAVPGDPDGYPTKDEMADYLEMYARHFELPTLLSTGIESLRWRSDRFEATTSDGRLFESRAVVLANGAFQIPQVPALSCNLSPEMAWFSTESYRRPAQLPTGKVVVVGDGASGRQIALELSATHQTYLSTGRPRRVGPERILGRSAFWWMDKTGILTATRESAIGKYLMKADPFPGRRLRTKSLIRHGVAIVPRLSTARGTRLTFDDGRELHVNAVVWTTGYREDTGWVDIPEAKDQQRRFVHQRGITPVPGLYLLGRSWQWTRGSALLWGVGNDARFLVDQLRRHVDPAAQPVHSSTSAAPFKRFDRLVQS
jgi:putative flavoprotein involved in K+ transport